MYLYGLLYPNGRRMPNVITIISACELTLEIPWDVNFEWSHLNNSGFFSFTACIKINTKSFPVWENLFVSRHELRLQSSSFWKYRTHESVLLSNCTGAPVRGGALDVRAALWNRVDSHSYSARTPSDNLNLGKVSHKSGPVYSLSTPFTVQYSMTKNYTRNVHTYIHTYGL
jgi:hypothetical protein